MVIRSVLSMFVFVTLIGVAYPATPSVETVVPGVGQRGTEFTLTITGARLTDPQELMIDSHGIVCTKVTAKSESEVVAVLRAAADCPLGEHPFRLRTAGGASELRTLQISPFPVVNEVEPNDKSDQAQVIPLNSTVAGTIESLDVDRFSVTLKKGQRLSAEVIGVRLGYDVTDTAITITGPDQKVLTTADDNALFRQDPFATLMAPTDGNYVIEVRDSTAGTSSSNRYLLHVGTFPRPAAVYPPGGQAGADVAVKWIGAAVGTAPNPMKLPAAGQPFSYYPSDYAGTAPTPNPFRVSAFPNQNEVEPNDDRAQSNGAVNWPVAFNGIIEKAGDVDHFRFRAKSGDIVHVQTFAYRLGSPVDTVVTVLDSAGEPIGINDDDETHDSVMTVTIPSDDEYFVKVVDKRNQGGSDFIYRVELDKPKIGLKVFLPERTRKSQERQVIVVPRGNRVTAFLGVQRDGFDGPVTITSGELPKGVKVGLGSVPLYEYLMPVVFEAAADAPLGGRLVDFTGTCVNGSQTIRGQFSQEFALSRGPGDSVFHNVTVSKLAVIVVEEAPYSVALAPVRTNLTQDGTLELNIKVTRAKDFTEPLEITFPCLPPGVEAPTRVVIPTNKDTAAVTLVASPVAQTGDWPIVLETQIARAGRGERDPLQVGMNGLGTGAPMPAGGRKSRRVKTEGLPPVASQPVFVKITDGASGKFSTALGEQGKSIQVTCRFSQALQLPSDFTATLTGLPPRSTAAAVVVKPGAKEVVFAVQLDATTPLGLHDSLECELSGEVLGQKVITRVGRGGVLTVAAPGTLKTDSSGKPLSPLDALRAQQKKP